MQVYDIHKRTLLFAENVINLANSLSNTASNRVIINQIVKSATSVGANYSEACEAFNNRDKIVKISICRKEAKETVFWLELIQKVNRNIDCNFLINESLELTKIFAAIFYKLKLVTKY